MAVCSFLHQASIVEQYRKGVLDKALLLSIIGIVSAIEDLGEHTRQLGGTFIDQAAAMVLQSIERPTVPRIQALILIIKYRILHRRFSSVFMLSSIAMRMALCLRLNYEDTTLCFLARESCRRTMWSLYLIDATIAAGYRDFTLCGPEIMHIKLPCQEQNFQLDNPPEAEKASDESQVTEEDDATSSSPTTQLIRIFHFRWRILRFIKQAHRREMTAPDIVKEIQSIRQELEEFTANLPPTVKLSRHNINLHSYSDSASNYVALHVHYYACHCILDRLALVGIVEALPEQALDSMDDEFRRECELRCFQHTKSLAELLQMVQSLSTERVLLDIDVAVSIFHGMRVLLRSYETVASRVQDSRTDVYARCQCCFSFLKVMFPDTPAVCALVCSWLFSFREQTSPMLTISLQIQDAETLLQQNLDLANQPNHAGTEAQPLETLSAGGRHVLYKHSYVGQIETPRKKDSFLPSPSSQQDETLVVMSSQGLAGGLSGVTPLPGQSVPDESTRPPSISRDSLGGFSQRSTNNESFHGVEDLYEELYTMGMPHFQLDASISSPSSWIEHTLNM